MFSIDVLLFYAFLKPLVIPLVTLKSLRQKVAFVQNELLSLFFFFYPSILNIFVPNPHKGLLSIILVNRNSGNLISY